MRETKSRLQSVTGLFHKYFGLFTAVYGFIVLAIKVPLLANMSKKQDAYTVIPVEEREMGERPNATATDQAEDEMEERFDKDFWLKVKI